MSIFTNWKKEAKHWESSARILSKTLDAEMISRVKVNRENESLKHKVEILAGDNETLRRKLAICENLLREYDDDGR